MNLVKLPDFISDLIFTLQLLHDIRSSATPLFNCPQS